MGKSNYLIPLNDRIIVEPIVDTITEGGIILPGKKDDRPCMGTILHEGKSGVLSKGDTILFNQYTALKFDKYPDVLIIKEEDVYAKVK